MSTNHKPKPTVHTDMGICVDQFIEEGKTLFFECKKKAEAFAATIRSYVYDAQDGNKKPIGYCVPK